MPALTQLPETELYAVCTAHADTAQAAADKYDVKHAYSDVKTMGQDSGLDAALVAVRVPAHYAIAKDAIEAGKHVYCEWPLGVNLGEVEEMAGQVDPVPRRRAKDPEQVRGEEREDDDRQPRAPEDDEGLPLPKLVFQKACLSEGL